MGRLDEVDLTLTLSRKEYERLLALHGWRLAQLRLTLGGLIGSGALGPPLCVLFEGWDATGKGGAIKRLVGPLDARHVRVVQYAAPTPDEKRHYYLHRFMPALPGRGGMAVFDRTWYGRVLVERVEGFATEEQWQRAYGEIVDFERAVPRGRHDRRQVLAPHLRGRAAAALRARARIPLKQWKLTDEDWRNRETRDDYAAAVEEMFERTDRPGAWRIVPAETKRHARVHVMQEVIAEIEEGCAQPGFPLPAPLEVAASARAPTSAQRRPAKRPPSVARRTTMRTSIATHTAAPVSAGSTSGRKTMTATTIAAAR